MWPRGKGHPLMSKSFFSPLCWQGGSKEMCSLGGREVRRGREGRRECVKGWVVAGERKGERAERVEGGGVRKWSKRGGKR